MLLYLVHNVITRGASEAKKYHKNTHTRGEIF